MNRFNDDDDDSSVATESDASSSRVNRAHSLVKLPSMYSPASNASTPDEKEKSSIKLDDDASSSSIGTNASSIDIDYDYDGLPVSDEIKELFAVIGNYEPVDLELETPLKCFMPSYICSIGDVDDFVKIPRPDGLPDGLGTVVLDEPIPSRQSNAAVIELQLRNQSMQHNPSRAVVVRSITNATENANEINDWIQSVEKIHHEHSASKHPSGVQYHNKMPSVPQLLQVWQKEMTEVLQKDETVEIVLPNADIDLSVQEYARMVCSLLDIPVYEGRVVESIHVLMSLFVEIQATGDDMFA